MKKYTDKTIKNCNEEVFGIAHLYENYYIQDGRVIGKNRIKRIKYISVNEYDFLKETKNIGKKLYELLSFKSNGHFIKPIAYKDDTYYVVGNGIIKEEFISQNIEEIINIIKPFIKKYGIPIYYDYREPEIENNSIRLLDICNLLLVIHIVSDLYKNNRIIDKFFEALCINKNSTKEIIIERLLSLDFINYHKLEQFDLIYDNSVPLKCTNNLFSFAFNRLKLDIIQYSQNNKILYRNQGLFKQENIKGKNARAHKKKVPSDYEELKIYNAAKSKKCNDKKAKQYKQLIKYRAFLIINDINNNYIDLINNSKDIRKQKDYKIKKHETLLYEMHKAYKQLKNDRN